MGYQPWYTTCTYPALRINLSVDGVNDDITGLSTGNLSMILRNVGVAPPTDAAGTGTFAIVTASPAVITYQFSSGDVASAGSFELIVKAVFPGGGGGTAVYDPVAFAITQV